jgi:hypothetical protein
VRLKTLLAGVVSAVVMSSAAVQAAEKPLMKDFIGINGHTVGFDAKLYAPVARLARDYHPYLWDVHDKPGAATALPMAQHIDWDDKSGKFRSWHKPVDWKELYGDWIKAGFEIDATIQIEGVPYAKWPDRQKNLFEYGKAFAECFGPSHENLVTSAEIGNEPAGGGKGYTPEQYKEVFQSMAKGLRAGDPKIKIVTCAVQAGKTDGYCEPIDVLKGLSNLYDVINLHQYAFLKGWPSMERTYPEDPRFHFIPILEDAIKWRNQNAPGKPVWITEFGYDASTKQSTTGWKGCTDMQQAQWIVRSFLAMSAIDIQRAYLYFFDDGDTPSLHAASGITRNFEPKMSYWAMGHLYRSLGDYRLNKPIEKVANGAYVFEYVNGQDPTKLVWVVWSATGANKEMQKALTLPGKVVKAERMPTTKDEQTAVTVAPDAAGKVSVQLTESPLYIWIEK